MRNPNATPISSQHSGNRRGVLVAALACASAAMTLAGCSQATDDATTNGTGSTETAVTVTKTVSPTGEQSPKHSNQGSGDSASGANSTRAQNEGNATSASGKGTLSGVALREGLKGAVMDGLQPEQTFTVGGQTLRACVIGDGYGAHIVAAGGSGSCAFAEDVFRVQTKGLSATEDNVRDHLSPKIRAYSETTHKTYDAPAAKTRKS
nr:hypothetical protein [Corynebacterium lactis]